jgi:hypothetical protein
MRYATPRLRVTMAIVVLTRPCTDRYKQLLVNILHIAGAAKGRNLEIHCRGLPMKGNVKYEYRLKCKGLLRNKVFV